MSETHDVAVLGAGDMGHGFAAHFAVHGHDVTLLDHWRSNLDDAEDRIRGVVAFLRSEGLTERSPDDVTAAVESTLDRERGLATADLVLESVPEELDLKRDVFREIDEPNPLLDEHLAAGRGGIHSGAGFFEYDDSPAEITRARDEQVAAVRRALDGVGRTGDAHTVGHK
ncbi:MAG: 3-hydroxyacyl-CoA dehydrogenase NAD-binding domain-containing protein [Haloarculaceae archaeon]